MGVSVFSYPVSLFIVV